MELEKSQWSPEFCDVFMTQTSLRVLALVGESVVTDHRTLARIAAGGADSEAQLNSAWKCSDQCTIGHRGLQVGEPPAPQTVLLIYIVLLALPLMKWNISQEFPVNKACCIPKAHWDHRISHWVHALWQVANNRDGLGCVKKAQRQLKSRVPQRDRSDHNLINQQSVRHSW